eukprot:253584_1
MQLKWLNTLQKFNNEIEESDRSNDAEIQEERSSPLSLEDGATVTNPTDFPPMDIPPSSSPLSMFSYTENVSEDVDMQLFRDLFSKRKSKSKSLPNFSKRNSPEECTQMSLSIRCLTRERMIEQKECESVGELELGLLADELGEDYIDYERFSQIRSQMPPNLLPYLTARVFSLFAQDTHGRVNSMDVWSFVNEKAKLNACRIALCEYDFMGNGWMNESAIENFIFTQIPNMPRISHMDHEFSVFYAYAAVRKFFFFLDQKRNLHSSGRILIKDLVSSHIFREFNEMRKDPCEALEFPFNWFSLDNTQNIYETYTNLDIDDDGMLMRGEFMLFQGRALTQFFVRRLFEEYKTFEGQMDYKGFLNFMLAYTYKDTPEALSYYFRIFDLNHCGYINGFIFHTFLKAIRDKIRRDNGPTCDPPLVEDVMNEIFDLLKPPDPHRITLSDFRRARCGAIVIDMLTDTHGFINYDNREARIHPMYSGAGAPVAAGGQVNIQIPTGNSPKLSQESPI